MSHKPQTAHHLDDARVEALAVGSRFELGVSNVIVSQNVTGVPQKEYEAAGRGGACKHKPADFADG